MHLQFPIYYIDDEGSNQHPSLSFYIHQRTCLLKNWHNLYVYVLCLVLEMFTFHKILYVKLLFHKEGGHFNKETTPQSSLSFIVHIVSPSVPAVPSMTLGWALCATSSNQNTQDY